MTLLSSALPGSDGVLQGLWAKGPRQAGLQNSHTQGDERHASLGFPITAEAPFMEK